ncbi:MAG: LPS export ABC transporter periplasmic protein LptC [Chitinophagales bacterium]|nr:LPS export ABC transporter periplasmic protein LptC [Chitinophagales bacterium]
MVLTKGWLGLFLIVYGTRVAAQQGEPITITNADALTYNEASGSKAKHLVGNVVLQQRDVTLICDNADFDQEKNVVDATGNVHIKQADTINIYGDQLHYDGNSKMAQLTKNVRLTNTHMVLTTEVLNYDLNTRIASYLQQGTIVNDSAVLTSNHGYYFATTGDVYFKKDVKLAHPDYILNTDTLRYNVNSKTAFFLSPTTITGDSFNVYCEGGYYNTADDIAQFEKHARLVRPPQALSADTIYYERINGFGFARSKMKMVDSSSQVTLTGNFAEYFDKHKTVLATGHPLMVAVMDTDSMYMRADTFYTTLDSSDKYRSIYAYHHVKIFKSDLQGICDSISYSDTDSTFRLFRNPALWVDNNQLTADTMWFQLRNKTLYKMELIQNAFAANQADSTVAELFNQVQGKNMYGYFDKGELRKMECIGNGESVYYAKDDSSRFIGVNKAVCSNITIHFEDKKVDRIYFITQPDATFFPLDQFPAEESRLKNFEWLIDKKPKSKEDLLK